MPFIFIGLCAMALGLFMYRRGKKSASNETKFGSFGLIFGGLLLVIAFLLLLFTKQV